MFYINYVGCKCIGIFSHGRLHFRFILTMWDVNMKVLAIKGDDRHSFILTMWDVNFKLALLGISNGLVLY
ncbi:MAG: hypothetical protein PWP27_2341 [Clostridiales bacterium]|nr:hypothetical protein [Clostridiales bacterium]